MLRLIGDPHVDGQLLMIDDNRLDGYARGGVSEARFLLSPSAHRRR